MKRSEIAGEAGGTLNRRSFLRLMGGLAGGVVAGAALPRLSIQAEEEGLRLPAAAQTVSSGTKHFYIYATDGYLTLPDGMRTYIRGFAGNNPPTTPVANPSALIGKAQLPAPLIEAIEGDDCYIHFQEIGNSNPVAPMDPHTIHLHGIHTSTQNDGFPEASFEVLNQSVTYYFKAEHPGTFMYHCHVEASEHVQMGMYGALIVRPRTNTLTTAYGGIRINGQFADRFDKEYIMLLSDLDTRWHRAVEVASGNFNPVDFRPDYWLLNGRSFPDTLLPAQTTFGANIGGPPPKYGAYVHVRTGQRFLLRMINVGYQVVPWHLHGWHFLIVGKDAHPMLEAPKSLLQKGYTLIIGSGETYDLIVEADDRSAIYGNKSPTGVNYVPVPKEEGGTHTYDGTPATFFPQFFPMHNHDDYKVTNNGIYPGGALTLIQADAP